MFHCVIFSSFDFKRVFENFSPHLLPVLLPVHLYLLSVSFNLSSLSFFLFVSRLFSFPVLKSAFSLFQCKLLKLKDKKNFCPPFDGLDLSAKAYCFFSFVQHGHHRFVLNFFGGVMFFLYLIFGVPISC